MIYTAAIEFIEGCPEMFQAVCDHFESMIELEPVELLTRRWQVTGPGIPAGDEPVHITIRRKYTGDWDSQYIVTHG